MYCDKVIELLKELERSREDTIPPYNVLFSTINNFIQTLYTYCINNKNKLNF
jgi:hypothetical protein